MGRGGDEIQTADAILFGETPLDRSSRTQVRSLSQWSDLFVKDPKRFIEAGLEFESAASAMLGDLAHDAQLKIDDTNDGCTVQLLPDQITVDERGHFSVPYDVHDATGKQISGLSDAVGCYPDLLFSYIEQTISAG